MCNQASSLSKYREAMEAIAQTVVAVARDNGLLGILGATDEMKSDVTAALDAVLAARGIGWRSYRRTQHNVLLAFLFNGIGVPLASPSAPGPLSPPRSPSRSFATGGRPASFPTPVLPTAARLTDRSCS